MSDVVQNLLNNVLQDGARPSKFRCEVTLPTVFEKSEQNLDVICKSAIFPTKTNDIIMVKYKGRNVPVPGQERFGHTLDLTFYADAKHKYRSMFYEWAQALNFENYSENKTLELAALQSKINNEGLGAYKTNIILTQLNFEGDLDEVSYNFYNVFPREVGQINMGSETISTISEFSVTFSYSHFDIVKKKEGINADNIANAILGKIQDTANSAVNKAMGYISDSTAGKYINEKAAASSAKIQDAGKTVGTSIDEFLG